MSYAAVNGLKMYYEVHGAGPALLLLHGGTGSINPASTVIPFFANHYRVIAIEQMGHGRTADAPDRSFHYHDMAEDTVELMRQLEIDSAVAVGFSDGGILGLDMAIHHPLRVTKLAVTGANTRLDGYTDAHWKGVNATPDAWPASEAYVRLSPDGAGHWPVLLERLQRMWAVEPNYSHDEIAGIKSPTLLIVGDRDLVTVEHALEMYRTIPGAQLCIVPNAGHGVMPKEAILAFLQEAPSGTP